MSVDFISIETSEGIYTLRTKALEERRHAEIEVIGVPHAALQAAASLIADVVGVVIERRKSELKAGENVGIPLTIIGHEDLGEVFLGVRAVQAEAPTGGFFSRIRGKGKGVLRLVDLLEPEGETPRIAIATEMLFRANCRVVTDDLDGAIAELRDAIALVPAPEDAQRMPTTLDTGGAKFNWQNHLVHLRLAELLEDDAGRSATLRATYARFPWLAIDELGAPLDAWWKLEPGLDRLAEHILKTNLDAPGFAPGPHPALRAVASPIWTALDDDKSHRRVSLLPESFVAYYFGGRLADGAVAGPLARFAARAVERYASEPWRLAALTSDARSFYGPDLAPTAAIVGERRTASLLLSAAMADAARKLHVGATWDEIDASFGLRSDDDGSLAASLAAKLATLEESELAGFMSGIGVGLDAP